jgi:hypothetical protein
MVFEHNWEDEIQAEKEESMKEIKFLLEYELMSLWWAEYVAWQWLRDIVSHYITWKVMRKWRRYKLIKMIADVTDKNGSSKERTSRN